MTQITEWRCTSNAAQDEEYTYGYIDYDGTATARSYFTMMLLHLGVLG